MTVALVRFTPGARTNWHRHAVGQTLHVTEGVGLVGTRDGTVLRISAGDTVVCPPDEEHWHGAGADTFMSHLAMLENLPDGGDPTTCSSPCPTRPTTQVTSSSPRGPRAQTPSPATSSGFQH